MQQNESEQEAQKEVKAEASAEHMAMVEYVHAHLEHFQQIDECHVQGVLTWQGQYLICTFYRDIEDLMDDTWKLIVEDIEFVGVENANEISLCGDQVMGIQSLEDEDNILGDVIDMDD